MGKEWVVTPVTIKGKERYLSAWQELGEGEIMFLVSFDRGYVGPRSFIMDPNIEAGQNLEAAMRLANWLAGKTEYPR